MDKKKILIIIGVGVVVIIAAFLTVGSFMTRNSLMMGESEGGFSPMSSTGLPGGTVSFSNPMAPSKSLSRDVAISPESAPIQSSEVSDTDSDQDKKIIKNGNLTFNVNSVDRAVESISRIAKDNGGNVFSSNFFKNSKDLKSGTIIIKVPVANFEKTFSEVKKVAAVVVRESTSGQDVTEQYQDLETRIKNKQAEEEAYKKILEQATKIDDILSITRQLSIVRGEIESLQGRLKYLASQTDMSTISITMSEDTGITVSDSWRPLQVAKEAVNTLIQKSQGFINFLIVLVIIVIPVALLYLLLFWIAYRIGRWAYHKIWKKKENQATEQK